MGSGQVIVVTVLCRGVGDTSSGIMTIYQTIYAGLATIKDTLFNVKQDKGEADVQDRAVKILSQTDDTAIDHADTGEDTGDTGDDTSHSDTGDDQPHKI